MFVFFFVFVWVYFNSEVIRCVPPIFVSTSTQLRVHCDHPICGGKKRIKVKGNTWVFPKIGGPHNG